MQKPEKPKPTKINPRHVKGTGYLRKLDPEVNKILKDQGITRDDFEDYIDHFFSAVKEKIMDPRMPKIKITHFGTFSPRPNKLGYNMRGALELYLEGKRDKEYIRQKWSTLWPVRKRLKEEKAGKATWQTWRKLNLVDNEWVKISKKKR